MPTRGTEAGCRASLHGDLNQTRLKRDAMIYWDELCTGVQGRRDPLGRFMYCREVKCDKDALR